MISSTNFIRTQFLNLIKARVADGDTPKARVIAFPQVVSPEVRRYQAEHWRAFQGALMGIFSQTPEEIEQICQRATQGLIETFGQEAHDQAMKWFDIPERVRDLSMSLEGSFTRAHLIVRNLLLREHDPLKAMDLLIQVLQTKHQRDDVAYFEELLNRARGGEIVRIEEIPQNFLREAYEALEKGRRCTSENSENKAEEWYSRVYPFSRTCLSDLDHPGRRGPEGPIEGEGGLASDGRRLGASA